MNFLHGLELEHLQLGGIGNTGLLHFEVSLDAGTLSFSVYLLDILLSLHLVLVEFVGVLLSFTILEGFLAFIGDILLVLLKINLNVLLVSLILLLHGEESGIQITLKLGLVDLDPVCSFLIATFAGLDVVNKIAQCGSLLGVRSTF